MNIVKQLYENGVRFGFIVEDGDATYAIPLEGLYVKTIYKSLLASGYKLLNKEDNEMICNGITTSQLPIEEASAASYADAFNRIRSLPKEKNLETMSADAGFAMASRYPTDFTITTRADFLKYINSIRTGVGDNDFMPINYFVSPAARFTLDELKSGTYADQMRILENRRRLSYNRYKRLKNAVAKARNMQPKDVGHTLVNEYYFSFGIDGVNLAFESDNTHIDVVNPFSTTTPDVSEATPKQIRETQAVISGYYKRVTCLMSNEGADIIFPNYTTENERKTARYGRCVLIADDIHASAGEYVCEDMVIPVRHLTREMITTEGDKLVITPFNGRLYSRINDEYGRSVQYVFSFQCLTVKNPAVGNLLIPISDWDRGDDYFITQAKLAASLMNVYHKRVTDDVPSTYDILVDMGLSPAAAVGYIAAHGHYLNAYNTLNETKDNIDDVKKDNRLIMQDDIRAFFSAPTVDEALTLEDLPSYIMSDGNDGLHAYGVPIQSSDVNGPRFVTGEERLGFIADILNGADGMGDAPRIRDSLLNPNVSSQLKVLQTAIDCLGFDPNSVIQMLEEFAVNSVNDYEPQDVPTFFTLEKDGKRINVGTFARPYDITEAAMGLRAELMGLRITEANVFFMVDDVAYELTNDPRITKRAVAIHGTKCIMRGDRIKEIINTLYEEFIDEFGVDTLGELTARNLVLRVILELYRRKGDLSGVTGLPASWYKPWAGHEANDWRKTITDLCSTFYESLACACEEAYINSAKGVRFRHVCVNADLYLDRVVPHGKEIIHEVPLREVIHSDEVQQFIFGPDNTPELAAAVKHYYSPYMQSGANLWCASGAQHLVNAVYGHNPATDKPYYDEDVHARIHEEIHGFNMSTLPRTPERLQEVYNYICSLSARAAKLASYDLEFYFYRAFRDVITNNALMVAPQHPADLAYPFLYKSKPGISNPPTTGIDTFRPVCKDGVGYKPAEGYHRFALAGPNYDSDTCMVPTAANPYGEEHLVTRVVQKPAITTNIAKGPRVERAYSIESADLIMNSDLAFFADDKPHKFHVEPGVGVIYDIGDEIVMFSHYSSANADEIRKLSAMADIDSNVAPIFHVTRGVHYFYDESHNLYRVEVPNENY